MRGALIWLAASAAMLAGCTTPRAPDQSAAHPGQARRVDFVCDHSASMSVTFSTGRAALEGDGVAAQLIQQPVASGTHYTGEGHDLRGKGPELVWTKPSGEVRTCREQEWAMRQPQVQEPRRTLSGTSWTLVHFQSSDDAVGTVVPPRVERYTMTFSADGALTMQLDCNRARGRWEVSPTSPGALAITSGAMTRAFCGPGALDAQIARDVSRLRSYTFAGDQLALALEADGGVYLWKPSPEGGS